MIVAGLGARSGVGVAEVLAALDAALAAARVERFDALATFSGKENEAGIKEAAKLQGLPLMIVSDSDLAKAEPRVSNRSALVKRRVGTSSVAEAAALAATGSGSRLLLPRLVCGRVTCAVAVDRPMP